MFAFPLNSVPENVAGNTHSSSLCASSAWDLRQLNFLSSGFRFLFEPSFD